MRLSRFVLISFCSLFLVGFVHAQPTVPIPPPGIGLPPPPMHPGGDGASVLPPPKPKPKPKIWLGEVELGISGTEGNSQSTRFRFGGKVKRKTTRTRFTLDALYRYSRANDVLAEDRVFVNDKFEWLFPGSKKNMFLSGTTEYDQFKAFDVRIARHAGLSADFIDNDITTLTGRAGAGASREFGGPMDRWVPELLFGGDFEHKLTELQKIVLSFDYFPDVGDFTDYRMQVKATYEIVINPEMGLTLRLGVLNLFDSTPGAGRQSNDLDYFATLLWKF